MVDYGVRDPLHLAFGHVVFTSTAELSGLAFGSLAFGISFRHALYEDRCIHISI